jgi:hypothetical protein
MIPQGYITAPEVLQIVRSRIDHDDLMVRTGADEDSAARESLATAIRTGEVTVHFMQGGALSYLWYTDREQFIEGWETWLASGRVANGSKYNGLLLLFSPFDIDWWLGPAPKTETTKTGAPGRPSSMGIVMTEFEWRRADGGCESSREAEANFLATWLKEKHPNVPKLTAKSIRNKLPPDFQPFSQRCPK